MIELIREPFLSLLIELTHRFLEENGQNDKRFGLELSALQPQFKLLDINFKAFQFKLDKVLPDNEQNHWRRKEVALLIIQHFYKDFIGIQNPFFSKEKIIFSLLEINDRLNLQYLQGLSLKTVSSLPLLIHLEKEQVFKLFETFLKFVSPYFSSSISNIALVNLSLLNHLVSKNNWQRLIHLQFHGDLERLRDYLLAKYEERNLLILEHVLDSIICLVDIDFSLFEGNQAFYRCSLRIFDEHFSSLGLQQYLKDLFKKLIEKDGSGHFADILVESSWSFFASYNDLDQREVEKGSLLLTFLCHLTPKPLPS